MDSLRQQFDDNKFNFTKINADKELIFQMKNLDDSNRKGQDQVIINVSPIDRGNSLLLPQVDHKLPQVLTEYGIRLALEVIFLSNDPELRIMFNSLCAYASVNHQHWHLEYFKPVLPIQVAKLTELGSIHILPEEEYPAPGFVFLLNSPKDIEQTVRMVHKLTSWLTDKNVAHNVLVIRGKNSAGEGGLQTVRVFVWARETVVGAKDPGAFVTAVCELSGQILVYKEDEYEKIVEEDVVKAQETSVLQTFLRVKDDVAALYSLN